MIEAGINIPNTQQAQSYSLATSFGGAVTFFSTIIYSFEGIGVVVPVENRMKDRSKFTPMMLGCYCFIAILFLSLGIVGYLGYGTETPGEISLALSREHTTPVSQVVNAALAFSVIFTYPLQLYPAVAILEEPILSRLPTKIRPYKGLNRWVLRWLIVFFTAVTAVLIPNFSALIALIGALGSATLSLTLPALFHLKGCILDQSLEQRPRFWKAIAAKDGAIIAIGVFGMVTGTAKAIIDIINGN
mmetsp:Transcript_5638/g.14284  ORF Transcript_5638/g.14284 Transcript_5638/m.14284 type:complete len:245 (-) Transcript_5638:734-1468(-)